MKSLIIPSLFASSALILPALTFHPVTGIATPNMLEGNPGGNPLTNIIEGAGVGFDSNEPHTRLGGTWYTDAPGGFPSDYLESNPGDEIIILDLGADATLYELSYWGYADTNGNGIRDFAVRFATDAEGGDPALGDEAFGTSIVVNPIFSALIDSTNRQSFPLGQAVTARYIEIKALTNYFDIVVGGDRLGIGEISFALPPAIGAPDIQAPAELALTLDATKTTSHDLPLLNMGDLDLEVSSIVFSGPNGSAFGVASSLPAAIIPFHSGPLQIQFEPSGLGGEISAIATVTSNDPDQGTVQITITGTLPPLGPDLVVTNPVDLTLSTGVIEEFGIPVTNNGGTLLTISDVTFTGADAAAVSLVSQPGTVASGAGGVIEIRVDSSLFGQGAIEVTMVIASDDVDSPDTEVVLNGGLPVEFHPIASVQTNTVNFYSELNLFAGIGNGFETAWPHHSIGGGEPAAWVTDAPNGGAGNSYYDNDQAAPVIIFDLGSNVTLGEISTWGYSGGNTNGGKDYTLRFATDAEGGRFGLGDENFGNSITYSPSFEAAFDPLARDTEPFEQRVSARYVEMTITTNWIDLDGIAGGDRVGLGEVAFPLFTGGVNQFLGIVATERKENGDFAITFYSSPGIQYELERSLDGENWDRLGETVVGGDSDASVITDTNTLPDAKVALYRVIHPGN